MTCVAYVFLPRDPCQLSRLLAGPLSLAGCTNIDPAISKTLRPADDHPRCCDVTTCRAVETDSWHYVRVSCHRYCVSLRRDHPLIYVTLLRPTRRPIYQLLLSCIVLVAAIIAFMSGRQWAESPITCLWRHRPDRKCVADNTWHEHPVDVVARNDVTWRRAVARVVSAL